MSYILTKILFYLSVCTPALLLFDGVPMILAIVVLIFASNFPIIGDVLIFVAQVAGLLLGRFSSSVFLFIYLLLMLIHIVSFFIALKGFKK